MAKWRPAPPKMDLAQTYTVISFVMLSVLLVPIHASDLGFMDAFDMLSSRLHQMNDSYDCYDYECIFRDDLEPPPEWLLPPPPIPPFLADLLIENESVKMGDECTFCHLFAGPLDSGSELVYPESKMRLTESWLSLIVAALLAAIFLLALFTVVVVKWKQWKVFSFSDSFIGRQKSVPPPSSPSDSCIAPVVNEKSPQSIITNFPSSNTISRSQYWPKSNDNIALRNGIRSPRPNPIMDDYARYSESGSCTSSPVYAELDSAGDASISPYAVHTYSEVAELRGLSAALRPESVAIIPPDASYDNAAYLSSSNSDQYAARNLRSSRQNVGLAMPPPTSVTQQHIMQPPTNYYTAGRLHKKSRNPYGHPTLPPPPSSQPLQQQYKLVRSHQNHLDSVHTPRFSTLRNDANGTYRTNNAQSFSTFRAAYAGTGTNYRDAPKRQLPLVPGVRL